MATRVAPSRLMVVGQRRPTLGRIMAWIVLGLIIVVTLFPMWWVVRTSFSTQREIFASPTSLMPVGFTFDNYARALGMVGTSEAVAAGGSGETLQFWLYLRNSAIVTTLLVVGQLFFSSLAAYAFARLHFPWREKIFFIYL